MFLKVFLIRRFVTYTGARHQGAKWDALASLLCSPSLYSVNWGLKVLFGYTVIGWTGIKSLDQLLCDWLSYLSDSHVILHIIIVLWTRSDRGDVSAQHKDLICSHRITVKSRNRSTAYVTYWCVNMSRSYTCRTQTHRQWCTSIQTVDERWWPGGYSYSTHSCALFDCAPSTSSEHRR